MHINHEYVLNFIKDNTKSSPARVLDYGCGKAETVSACRAHGIECFGAELFTHKDRRQQVREMGYLDSVVKEIKDGKIGFEDDFFDIVVNNMVFEHVEKLDKVLEEISRVMKPGGMMLSMFPSKEMIREGHCGIPMLHWFPKKSSSRAYYAYLFRSLGFGYHTKNIGKRQWVDHFCSYIDNYTFYRPKSEIVAAFSKHFHEPEFIESDYILFRARERIPSLYWLFRLMLSTPITRAITVSAFRKVGFMVFISRKRPSSNGPARI